MATPTIRRRNDPRPWRAAALLRGGVAALCVALWPARAGASELTWHGPPGCEEREQLEFQVERALGAPLAKAGTLQLAVYVERARPPLSARLGISGGLGSSVKERVLVAETCSQLVDTLAVAVALALGAAEPAESQIPEPPPRVAPAAAPPPDVADAPAPLPHPAEPARAHPSGLALLTSDLGALPSPAVGATVGAELAWPRLQLRLSGTIFLPQRVERRASAGTPRGADLELALAALHVCASIHADPGARLFIPLCAGAELGRIRGAGVGLPNPRDRAAPWVAALVETGLGWAVPHTQLQLRAQLGAVLPLNRDDFVLPDLTHLHRPSAVTARAALGISIAFH